MAKPVALFLDKASVHPDDLDFSRLDAVARWQWFDLARPDEIWPDLSHAEIIVSNKVMMSREVIAECRSLKLICVAATGFNNVDIDAARESGIRVCNVSAYATPSVTEHVVTLLLSLNRNLSSSHRAALDGRWSRRDFFCHLGDAFSDLDGKKIGIIGYGELGRSVARVAKCFGMEVLIAKRDEADTRPGRIGLSELLSQSDVVTLHCPLTENNRYVIAKDELSMMKPDAMLINTARGGLIDESALLEALENKQISGAALDVLEQEPPAIDNAVLSYPGDNLILTPHIAWSSSGSRQRLLDEIAKNIEAYQKGVPRNLV